MCQSGQERFLDAAELLFEIGRRVQAVSLVMRKHKVLPAQQLCECGRLATRVIPAFGLRCEIASLQWDIAHALMTRFLTQLTPDTSNHHHSRSVGMAKVLPAQHHRPDLT